MGGKTFSIGEAAAASGLPVKTIRYYEEIGLIPRAMRTNGSVHAGGHRVYSHADVGRLRFIHHARLFGLSLADIRELVALAEGKGCPSQQPEYRRILKGHLDEIDERAGRAGPCARVLVGHMRVHSANGTNPVIRSKAVGEAPHERRKACASVVTMSSSAPRSAPRSR